MATQDSVKVLFVGNFYDDSRGSHNIGSKIVANFDYPGFVAEKVTFPRNPFLRLLRLPLEILTRKYDVIHLETYSGRYFRTVVRIVVTLAKLRKKKIMLNLQGGALPEFFNDNKALVQKYLPLAHARVCPSKRIIHILTNGIPGLNIEYLPSFIDNRKFPFSPRKFNTRKLLWVRAFDITYHPQIAIEAIKLLTGKFSDVTLTMVGSDRGLLQSCKDLVTQYGLQNRVTFIGPVDNAGLHTYFHDHDIYLNTTRFESFGFALVEAASCGIPIISSKVGEIPYLWEENSEIVFYSVDDTQELVQKIIEVIEDEELKQKLAVNARKKSEMFTWNSFSSTFFRVLNNIAHG